MFAGFLAGIVISTQALPLNLGSLSNADESVTAMNWAAEQAVPEAKTLLGGATRT